MFVKRMNTISFPFLRGGATCVALMSALSACDSARDQKTSQVAANVDGTEITVHQLNAELGRLNVSQTADPAVTDRITSGVLSNLIDQQLLVAQAKEKKLDRTPEVVQAIESAKRQILAQAYIRQLSGSAKAPDDKELGDYYAKHPELFQNRKLYTLNTIIVSKQNLKPAAVDALQKGKSLADAAAYLKKENIAYQQKTVTHPAEDIPMDVLSKMSTAPTGQIFLIDRANQVTLFDVMSAIDQPITLDQAKPTITRFLSNQSNEQHLRDELDRLRKTAKISYLGKFADQKPAAAAPEPAPGIAQPATTTGTIEAASSPSMDRGLSGLK